MCGDNETKHTEIYLLGFQSLHNLRPLLFVVLFLLYMATVGGNLSIISLVFTNDNLKTPMFYFLQNLAMADVLLTTSVVLTMSESVLKAKGTISVGGCITQLYFFVLFGFVQCFLLAVMSYDNYVALSNPFNYILIMKSSLCFQLAFGSWTFMFSIITSELILIGQFEFCGPNSLNQFFCDYGPVIGLSSSDKTILLLLDFIYSLVTILFPFIFILGTYTYIFIIILKIKSSTGSQKTCSTCSSHLTIVCAYYGTFIYMYLIPSKETMSDVNKFRSLLYTLLTPLMNPIIYSMRNSEINQALCKKINL